MKKAFTFIFSAAVSLFFALPVLAQVRDSSAQWVWVHGEQVVNTNGSYGSLKGVHGVYNTKGTTTPGSRPGSRNGHITWVDKDGNLWLFGGYGFAASGTAANYLADMWKYDPDADTWTWMSGVNEVNKNGIYGTKGSAHTDNFPGGRNNGASWVDATGNLWLFGGFGYGRTTTTQGQLNDLWKYNPLTSEWTWVSGGDAVNSQGTYGPKGSAATTYVPGGRNAAAGWVDDAGDFWIWGGTGRTTTATAGGLNDLWKYVPATGEWAWLSGGNTINQPGTYGTKGSAATSYIPGCRGSFVYWKDLAGNVWIFGGSGYASNSTAGHMNELWKLNPATLEWSWESGDNTVRRTGVYGDRGLATVTNVPGSRYGVSGWLDVDGNLWVFGGYGYAASAVDDYLNDLWKYDVTSKQWTWMKGSNVGGTFGAYGTKGVPDAANLPTATYFQRGWADPEGNFWTFGGSGHKDNNPFHAWHAVLWKLAPLPLVPSQPGNFLVYRDTACTGESSVTYRINQVPGATSYNWTYTPTTGVTINGTDTSVTLDFSANAGDGVLSVIAENSSGSSVPRTLPVVVRSLPAVPGAFTAFNPAVCQGQNNVVYTVPNVAGVTYAWGYSGAGATVNGSGNSITVNYGVTAGDGTLSVTAQNICGTSAPRTQTVTVNPLPAQPGVYTAVSVSVCRGESGVVYTVPHVAGVTYGWTYSGQGVLINGSGNSITADFNAAATDGTLSVTATNTCGTSAPQTQLVSVHALPSSIITVTGVTDICTGDSVTLTASGSGYNYQWKNGTTVVAGTGNTFVAYVTGSYKAIVTDPVSSCADSTQPVDITVHLRPVVSLDQSDTSFCTGSKIQLGLTEDTSLNYRWKNGVTTIPFATAHFLEIEETGVYSVVVGRNRIADCADSTNEVSVTVHPLPVVEISWDGEILHATPGYVSYQWYTGSQPLAGATDLTYTPSVKGNYAVSATDSNGCSNISVPHEVEKLSVELVSLAGQIAVFPNPVSEMLSIKAPVAVNAMLMSVDGRLLFEGKKVTGIDMAAFPDGIYFLRIADESGVLLTHERLVKRSR